MKRLINEFRTDSKDQLHIIKGWFKLSALYVKVNDLPSGQKIK